MSSLPKKNLVHSKNQAAKLAVTVPSSVKKTELVIHKNAKELLGKIYKANGYYDQIAKANERLESYFKQALNSKGLNTGKVKTELTEAKKAAKGRASAATKRKAQCKKEYQAAEDMDYILNNT